MKRKMIVVLLVAVGLGVLVVQAVSQPAAQPNPPSEAPSSTYLQSPAVPGAVPAPTPYVAPGPKQPDFSQVQQPQQEWTFEQLVEALKGVRARQKELQAQEADLLTRMAKKVEEKRQDLSKSEATFQQLRTENGRIYPEKRFVESKTEGKK